MGKTFRREAREEPPPHVHRPPPEEVGAGSQERLFALLTKQISQAGG